MVRALNRQDANLVLDHVAKDLPDGEEARCCDMAWQAWASVTANETQLERSQQALLLYLNASRHGEALGSNLKRAALSLLCFAERLASDSGAEKARLFSALTSGRLAQLYKVAGSDAELLAPLLHCSPDWLRNVAESINQQPSEASGEGTESGRRYTSFGGTFLLLPIIDELPLTEACRAFDHTDEAAAISLVRFLLLIKCCGQRNAHRTFNDPLLRDLLLIPPTVSWEVIREWQSRIALADVQHFLRTLLEFQRTRQSVTGHEQILFRSDEGLTLLIDANRGLWLLAEKCESYVLRDLIRMPLLQLETKSGVLFCDASLIEELSAEFPAVTVLDSTNTEGQAEQVRNVLARLDKVPSELEHLALPNFQLSQSFDLALSIAAQHIMRAFAWQLPSFAQSNLLYFWTNFLDFSASFEEEPQRRVVRVGRPPLRLVLGFTGAMRQTYRLSWLDNRPVTLFEDT